MGEQPLETAFGGELLAATVKRLVLDRIAHVHYKPVGGSSSCGSPRSSASASHPCARRRATSRRSASSGSTPAAAPAPLKVHGATGSMLDPVAIV